MLASVPTSPGNGPLASPTMDDNGNLYGAAWSGLVFKLTHSGNNWVLTELGQGDLGISGKLAVDSDGEDIGTDGFGGPYRGKPI